MCKSEVLDMSNKVIIHESLINRVDVINVSGQERVFHYDDQNDMDSEFIVLYMYQLPKFPQHGIKIGMTKCKVGTTFRKAVETRIKEQTTELALPQDSYDKYGLEREVVYWGICLDARNDSFKDYYIHDRIKIKKSGIQEKEQEWFVNVPLDDLIALFEECRSEGEKKIIFEPRIEQRECIDKLKTYFSHKPEGGRFLMNCKMRFGKSYTAYKFCEEADLNKILILTFVPAVQSSWRDDLGHITKDYRYFTDDNLRRFEFQPANVSEPFVMFLSLQNFLGKEKNTGDTKARLRKLQSVHWDLVILDEYHFGAWNNRTKGSLQVAEMNLEDFDVDYLRDLSTDVIKKFHIRTNKTICLSGTPFKALASHEFGEAVYSYTYFDEQRNKYPNYSENDFHTVNPAYAGFPDMKIFGYDMAHMFKNLTGTFIHNKKVKRNFFSLNQFFKTRKDVNPDDPSLFINEEAVVHWLEIIKGSVPQEDGVFPYTFSGEMLSNCRHSLWLMPSIDSVGAMARLLRLDPYFHNYEIIDLSDPRSGVGSAAYNYLMMGMNKADNTNKLGSITLTVNKLTLGVTVKPWSAVFVLKDLASPEQYFQSIFRVQTPYKTDYYEKKYGFVYDFNVDRAAMLLLDFASESGENPRKDSALRAKIAKLIVKLLPIYLNGDMKNPVDEKIFYNLAVFGDPHGQPLSKKISDTSKTTRIGDDDTLALMMADPEVKKIIDRVFAHSKFESNTNTPIPAPVDDFDKEITVRGRDLGYKAGLKDFNLFSIIEDNQVLSSKFLEMQKVRAEESCPPEYEPEVSKEKYSKYYNAFVKGYESGLNVPVKNLTCGRQDGKNFVTKVRDKFGTEIVWNRKTGPEIKNFVVSYLNNDANIPEDYKSALFKQWYVRSFISAVRSELREKSDVSERSVEDADNVIRHILSRLFQFLYISVYRETTFDEIFSNADPDVFLEAVGITKEDFTVLNRYHIFEENTLNNCICDFFHNESLGSTLDLSQSENRDRYRNSFNWFGYGVED